MESLIGQARPQTVRAQHDGRLLRRHGRFDSQRGQPRTHLLGKCRIVPVACRAASLIREFAQCFQQRVAGMHRRGEGSVALLLKLCKTSEVEIVRTAVRARESRAPYQHERDTGHAMQAFVGRAGHGRQARVAEVDGFGTEAADCVDEQAQPSGATQFAQRSQVVEPTRRGFMMHDSQVRAAHRLGLLCERIHVQRLHPVADDPLAGNGVLRTDLRHPLAVHAVLCAQYAPGCRHQ